MSDRGSSDVGELVERTAALQLDSTARPSLRLQIPNPFEWFRGDQGNGNEREEVQDDVSMATASPSRPDRRVRTAPSLPSPPRYDGTTMQDRRDFMRRYETYLAAINALQTPYDQIYAMPVSACIESRTKHRIARWHFNKLPEQVPDLEWIEYFKQALAPTHVDYETVDQAMTALKMDLRLLEPESRMTKLQSDLEKILDKFNLIELAFEHEQRRLVTYMTAALEPAGFRSAVTTRLSLNENKFYRHNVVAFSVWVTGLLREFMSWERVASAGQNSQSGRGGGSSRSNNRSGGRGGGRASSDRGQTRTTSGGSTVANPTTASSTVSGASTPSSTYPCLKCGSTAHQVRECPQSSPEEAKRLLREMRAARRTAATTAAVRRVATMDEEKPQPNSNITPDHGTVDAVVDGVRVDGLLLDSGADASLVASGVVDAIVKTGKTVAVTEIPPIKLLPVGGSGFEVRRRARFREVVVSTSAGPLMLRDLECLVEEANDSMELTVGRPIMKLLGYSTDQLLVAARDAQPEWQLASAEQSGTSAEAEPTPFQRVCRLATLARDDVGLDDPVADMVHRGAKAGDRVGDSVAAVEADEIERHETRSSMPRITEPITIEGVIAYLERKIEIASQLGLTWESRTRLAAILHVHADCFRVEFGNDPPLKVEPLLVRLRPEAKPFRVQPRRYTPNDRAFLDRHTTELLGAGLIFVNHRSRWASAPRIVKKKEQATDPSADPRMTIDTRGVNERTEPMPWPMPVLEVVIGELEGARYFFVLDWFRGYWQLPLHPDCQEFFSFITHRGIYTPTRVPMGATDAVAFCQGAVEEIFGDLLGQGILAWLDDILGYAKSEDELLVLLEKVLTRCSKFGLKLHAKKCQFFTTEVKWCGKVFSAEGVKHCPERVQGLVEMQLPSTAAELQQFLCAVNWMRQSIPQFSALTSRLYAVLERAAKLAGSRKKTRLARVQLADVGWSREEVAAVEAVRQALLQMVPLAHPDPNAELCLYTDASQDHWGAVLTQLEPEQVQLPLDQQDHRPLAFLSGRFAGASSRWSTIEKEAFAIVESTRRLEYLLLRPSGFRLYTDHRNLVYIFTPYAHDSTLARYQADKLQRWALSLMAFRYVIEHVPGEQNAWGDLLSRWGAGSARREDHEARRISRLAVVERVSPLQDPEFVWPDEIEIRDLQRVALADPLTVEDGVAWDDERNLALTPDGRVWIPAGACDMQQRLCVVAHAGASGHRGAVTTTKALAEVFSWKTLEADVATFVGECLHCMVTANGRVPRPFGETLRATKPNELLHFDFLTMVESASGVKYVLVLKDGMSGFVELVACTQADSDQAYHALLDWFKRFGVVRQWVSDQGAHFKNDVIARLQRALGAHHHFTTAYTPWANGTVEVVNREVLKAVKALTSERRLDARDWPALLPVVQAALNSMPADRLGGRTPLTAFTALPGGSQLRSILHPSDPVAASIDWVETEIHKHLEEVRKSLDNMHHEMVESSERRRRAARQRHASRRGVVLHKFEIGDFVLAATATGRSGNKLALVWRGPKRILRALNDYTFEVQDLTPPFTVSTRHASRLQLYREAGRAQVEDLVEQAIHGEGGHLVEALLDCRLSPATHRWEIFVKWFGLDDIEASWEPAEVIQADVPVLYQRFVDESPDNPTRQQMAAALDPARRQSAVPVQRVPRRRGRRGHAQEPVSEQAP